MKITKHRIFEPSPASMTVERRSSALWQCRQRVRRTILMQRSIEPQRNMRVAAP